MIMQVSPPPPFTFVHCGTFPEVMARTGASHLISAINADLVPATPAGLLPSEHLKLDMHDIIEMQHGATRAGRRARRPAHRVRARLGPPSAAAHPLLRRPQPLDGVGLHHAVRAQSAGAGEGDRAGAAPGLRHRRAEPAASSASPMRS